MVNTITFGGVTSSTYDIYISGEGVWSAPKRDTEVITIPGRNGAFVQDKGRYENITVTYPAFIVKNNNTNFAAKVDAFRNAMISKIGYQRLQDTFHPDEYRMAAFIEGLEVEPILYNDHAATFDITFECKPQRYLTSGEEKKVLGTWGDTETKTGEIVELENDGSLAVKSAEVSLEPQQDTSGGVPSPSNPCPITGASDVDVTVRNKNLLKVTATSQTINDVVFTVDSNGVIDANGTASARVDLILNNGLRWEGGETYKVGGSIGGSASTWIIWVATHGTIASQMSMDGEGEFTQGSTAVNRVTLTIYGGVHVDHQKFYPMVRLASEGDSTFEPYNSTTTTTSLGTTVYGGSVDVVSGELTPTIGKYTGSDFSWTYSTAGGGCFIGTLPSNTPPITATGADGCLSDTYLSAYDGTEKTLGNIQNGEFLVNTNKASASYKRIVVKDNRYSDATAFSSAVSSVVFTIPYDTTTTSSITPTTVNLIEGTNYVFSPQGDLTLGYGTNPNALVNPTLFASSPMIEAKGYGDITFNGHTIKLQNGVVGTVNLWNNTKSYSINGTFTKQFQTGLFNPTDTFSFEVYTVIQVTETTTPTVTNTNPSATNSSSSSIGLHAVALPCTFTVSTSGTATNTCTYDFGSSKTVVVNMTCTYDASTGTVNYISSTSSTGGIIFVLGKGCYCGLTTCNATSTLNRLGDPTYIDCDLGEAYKINDGNVVGLNQFIDLGSKLPELAPGINEFTVSNTFTEVAVTPRWWTV